jgi:FkbM family methyltransferase
MRNKLIKIIKNLLINKPASWMPSGMYVSYVIVLSRFKLKYYSKTVSEKFSDFFIHKVTHNNQLIFFQSTVRINRFIRGFEHAGKRMWNRYKIDELLCGVEPRTIIDIGANIGEFSFYAHKKYLEKVEIFTFDPDPITKECIDNNLVGINVSINLVALSNKSGEEDFYLKTESADSSLHEPFGESVKIKTKIITLDSFFNNLELRQPVLLKMDTEGHEPEVLLGGIATLKHINWVSIDAGLERYGKPTSNDVARILVEQGFSEVNISDTHLVTGKK